jgi:multicomponent Na+:H+ antiporter subunit E
MLGTRREVPMHALLLFVSLLAFYIVLSGQIGSAFLMGAGVVSCAAITLLAKRLGIVDDEGMPYRWWWGALKYAPWLIWQIFLANVDVLKTVWRPRLHIQPQMIKVPHELRTAFGIATYMNSITLTPGTVTVEAGKDEFLVHALTQGAADGVRSGDMHRRVLAVERSGQRGVIKGGAGQ